MTTVLLFCTAAVPVATIDSLLLHCRDNNTTILPGDPPARFLSLVRYPSQAQLDPHCTTTPVEPFESGFIGASEETLIQYVDSRVSWLTWTLIIRGMFAVLDERSEVDRTVALHAAFKTKSSVVRDMMDIDPGPHADDKAWQTWRFHFEDLATVVTNMEFTPALHPAYLYDDFVDEFGAYRVQDAMCRLEVEDAGVEM